MDLVSGSTSHMAFDAIVWRRAGAVEVRLRCGPGVSDASAYVCCVWYSRRLGLCGMEKSGIRNTGDACFWHCTCGGCRLVKSCGTPSPLLLSPLSSMLPAKAKWLQVSNPGSSANFWYSKLSNCGLNLECYGRGHIIRLLPTKYLIACTPFTQSPLLGL